MDKTRKATELVRRFSDLLNMIRFRGNCYSILKGGKPVAYIGPLEVPSQFYKLGELKDLLKGIPQLGDEVEPFETDVKHIIMHQLPIIIEKFRKFFLKSKNEIEKNYSPYFYKYFEFYFSGQGDIKYYILLDKFRFELVGGFGKKILDVGCGFGLHTILYSMFGAGKINAIDFNEEKVEILKKLLNTWFPDGANIDAEIGDALSLNFPDKTFDIVFSIDMISHVRCVEPVISEINRVLKPGGIVYFDDGNNPFYLPSWRKRIKLWHEWEYGPLDLTKLRATDTLLPFIEIRKDIIKNRFPEMDNKIVNFLAKKTQGFYGDYIVNTTREIIDKKTVSKRPIFKYVNPITGEPMERPINPLRLKRKLYKNFNLTTHIVAPPFSPEYKGIKGILKKILYFLLKKIPIISLLFHELFIIIAKKDTLSEQ